MLNHEQFLQQILVPYFHHYNQNNHKVSLLNLECQFIVGHNSYLTLIDLDCVKTISKYSLQDIELKDLQQDNPLANLGHLKEAVTICKKLYKLQQDAIKQKQTIKFLFMTYSGCYLVIHNPIFHQDGTVVALEVTVTPFHLFGAIDFFHYLKKTSQPPQRKNTIKLTPRQQQILFLLLAEVTHEEIARELKLTRGTISKIISTSLSPKFGVIGSNTRLLKEKAREAGFLNFIPSSFLKLGLIMLDNLFTPSVIQ